MTIEQRFEHFHNTNPHVYETLVRLTRTAKLKGKEKIGIGMLWEVLRWESFIHTQDDKFKLNNDYRSRYARMIMDNEKDLANIFEVRGLRTN
ncbi:hypothetical protein P4V41_07885 [Fictibacillus nanhaiensis]|uniref:hypothetical protein n=1 Tax=Fictibacillus nanhaiensis TaxID=742169 RepID=UPI002E1D1A50|nr:hypothetical protein [Fictibacillus nanhaiensis]